MEIVLHYYQHHIGDFLKDTSRLTDAQSMAYLRLLWMYYDSERPLPDKVDVLAFQVGIDSETVRLILESYFRLEEGAWRHTRCDKEIAEYKALINKKSNAGKASAERKKNTSSTPVQQVLDTGSTDVQLTNNHKPVTNNQEPSTTTKSSSKGSRLLIDSLPSEWEEFCRQKKPELVPTDVFAMFHDYWIAIPGSKGVKADWFATWRNWVRNQRQTITDKKRKDDGWQAKLASLNTIDMEPSNGQVLSTDIVPF